MDKILVNDLFSLNRILENCTCKTNNFEEVYPNIFILGVPRAGTTLLNQIIAYSLDIGYINNLIARFWDAPYIGALVSKEIGLNQNINFNSNHGFTNHISDVHEFGFFWKKYFNRKWERDAFLGDLPPEEIDWKSWKNDILALNHVYKKPFVFKAINILPHIDHVKKILKKSIFVIIDRDPYDNAISILNARKKIKGVTKKWWSFKPYKKFNTIKEKSPEEQVAYQIKYIKGMIENKLKGVPFVKIKYENLCNNPEKEIKKIISTFKNKNYDFKFQHSSLNTLNPTRRNRDNYQLLEALKKVKLI